MIRTWPKRLLALFWTALAAAPLSLLPSNEAGGFLNVQPDDLQHLAASLSAFGPPAPSCFTGPSDPPRFDTVLVIAMGRSGSTSLLRLLNRLPCMNVRGETAADLMHAVVPGRANFKPEELRKAVKKLRFKRRWAFWNGTKYEDPGLPGKPAFFHRFDPGRVEDSLEKLEDLELSSRVEGWTGEANATRLELSRRLTIEFLEHVPNRITSGFKEISLFSPLAHSYSTSLAFLDSWVAMFPRTAFLILTRDDAGLRRSGWWRSLPESNATAYLRTNRLGLEKFSSLVDQGRYGTDVSLVRVKYDDAVQCDFSPESSLLAVYQTLGYLPDRAACAEVMGQNMEDAGIASSWLDWGPQGWNGWEYGTREVRRGKEPGTFKVLGEPVPVMSGTDADFRHPRVPSGVTLLRHSYSVPHTLENGEHLIPCRRWTNKHHTTAANVRVSWTIPGSSSEGCDFRLLFPGQREPEALQGKNGTVEFAVELSDGTQVEMCVATEDGKCVGEGVVASMVVVRKGMSSAVA
jgi:hypothetical protein